MSSYLEEKNKKLTLKEFLLKLKEWVQFVLKRWIFLMILGVIGGILGFLYAGYRPILYSAKMTFILEEGKSNMSGLGSLASLAGQFGVDVGGAGGEGVLSGDNILLYFKSPSLAREILLTQFDNKAQFSLADKYIEVYKLKEKWAKNEKIGTISFKTFYAGVSYSRLQDSLLQVISNKIISDNFNVARPDKKASFIDVTVEMEDEHLAKKYCERIVQRVVERYINVKIKRQKATVDKLQARVDSIANLLQQKTYSGASLQNTSSVMDINPLYRTKTAVAVESTLRDKTLLATIFASVTQNLEIAKFTLSQETPVIQIIDEPIYPLKVDKLSKLKAAVLSSIFAIIIGLFYIFSKRFFKRIMK
ncbi:MAG: hypothetical protein CUR34_00765 [Sediminibacterium sp.]|nr:MAG: hypothetical protein CUR34_00765 [Sediminibacterium sp.] [Sediminibacterium sp. FEMGT703S]